MKRTTTVLVSTFAESMSHLYSLAANIHNAQVSRSNGAVEGQSGAGRPVFDMIRAQLVQQPAPTLRRRHRSQRQAINLFPLGSLQLRTNALFQPCPYVLGLKYN